MQRQESRRQQKTCSHQSQPPAFIIWGVHNAWSENLSPDRENTEQRQGQESAQEEFYGGKMESQIGTLIFKTIASV